LFKWKKKSYILITSQSEKWLESLVLCNIAPEKKMLSKTNSQINRPKIFRNKKFRSNDEIKNSKGLLLLQLPMCLLNIIWPKHFKLYWTVFYAHVDSELTRTINLFYVQMPKCILKIDNSNLLTGTTDEVNVLRTERKLESRSTLPALWMVT